jgi:uncharacterized protein YndB with AHSA1/START domain
MTARAEYMPSPITPAQVRKTDGPQWGLVLTRELRHAPQKVWDALVDPEQLRQWAPFDASANLGRKGTNAKLTTVGAPQPHVTETTITRADAPRVLEYNWGGNDMKWELEPHGTGTRLTLWTSIDRRYIAMGAAGWHVCFDVLDHYLGGSPIGRMVGMEVMKIAGFQRVNAEYSRQFKERSE